MENSNDTQLTALYYFIGKEYRTSHNEDSAKVYWEKIILITETINCNDSCRFKQIKYKSAAQYYLGYYYMNNHKYSDAAKYLINSLSLRERNNDTSGIVSSLIGLAGVNYSMTDYSQSLKYYLKTLDYLNTNDSNNIPSLARIYSGIAISYWGKNELENALIFIQKALLLEEKMSDYQGMATNLNNMGTIYWSMENYQIALEHFLKALRIIQDHNIDKTVLSLTYNNIGDIYIKLGKYTDAILWQKKSLETSIDINDKEGVKYAHKSLSEVYALLNNYKDAYLHHINYSAIKDSLLNEESSKQITEMQTKYETEKKELQIENLNKDNAVKETEIKKQNVQKLAFASGFGLMMILAFVIFRGYKQKQKANEIISEQKSEVEKQKEIVDEKNQSLEVAYKHIEEKNTEILDSIRYAKRIQEAILPPQKLVKQYLEQSFILYKPKDIVAGDFYWMETIPSPSERGQGGEVVLFASVDCTGHGVPGAFMSILGFNGLNRCVKEFGLAKPAAILDKLCELVDEAFSKSEADIKDGMDIALCCYDYKNNILEYSGAGNSLYHIREDNLKEYSADKQPVGKYSYRKPFINHIIELQKNDSVYVFTDGYADQFGGPKGKKFKYKQFEELLLSIQDKTMTEQREILNKTIDEWRGEMEQIDDICIIGVHV